MASVTSHVVASPSGKSCCCGRGFVAPDFCCRRNRERRSLLLLMPLALPACFLYQVRGLILRPPLLLYALKRGVRRHRLGVLVTPRVRWFPQPPWAPVSKAYEPGPCGARSKRVYPFPFGPGSIYGSPCSDRDRGGRAVEILVGLRDLYGLSLAGFFGRSQPWALPAPLPPTQEPFRCSDQ